MMPRPAICRYSANAHDVDPDFANLPDTQVLIVCGGEAWEKYTLPVRGTDREFVSVNVCPKHLAELILRYEPPEVAQDVTPPTPTPLQRSAIPRPQGPDPAETQVIRVGDRVYMSPVTSAEWVDLGTNVVVERRGESWSFTYGEE